MLAFGVTFELPVFTFFGALGRLELPSHAQYLPVCPCRDFIVAAILTPTPDIINQSLLAGPMLCFI